MYWFSEIYMVKFFKQQKASFKDHKSNTCLSCGGLGIQM